MKNKICAVMLSVIITFAIVGCIPDNIPTIAIGTVAEYGTYFGLKQGKVDEKAAKYTEEALRVLIQGIDNESISGAVDVDAVLAKVPSQIKPFLVQAVNIVNEKYVTLRGKLSPKNAAYLRVILVGAKTATEKYRVSLSPSIQGDYETNLSAQYKAAIKTLK